MRNPIKRQSSLFILCALSAIAISCGSKPSDKPPETSAAPTYSDVSAFINTTCATSSCHNSASAAGGVDMSTQAKIQAKAASAAAAIRSGTMPKAGTAELKAYQADSASAAKLLSFLDGGAK